MQGSELQKRIYAEIVVGCDAEGCRANFIATEAAGEPVEEWAARATEEAETRGWTCSSEKRILCPAHGASFLSTVDYVEVEREAHQLSLSHGPTAHLYAMRLAETAEENGDVAGGQFWRAVYASIRPR